MLFLLAILCCWHAHAASWFFQRPGQQHDVVHYQPVPAALLREAQGMCWTGIPNEYCGILRSHHQANIAVCSTVQKRIPRLLTAYLALIATQRYGKNHPSTLLLADPHPPPTPARRSVPCNKTAARCSKTPKIGWRLHGQTVIVLLWDVPPTCARQPPPCKPVHKHGTPCFTLHTWNLSQKPTRMCGHPSIHPPLLRALHTHLLRAPHTPSYTHHTHPSHPPPHPTPQGVFIFTKQGF